MIFDETGTVSGIEVAFVDYLDTLVEIANRHGLNVMLSLTDNTMADGRGFEHQEFLTDTDASESFIANAQVPIVERLEKRDVVWDLFNEPENVTQVPLRTIQLYVDRVLQRLRQATPNAKFTVVSRGVREMIYWRGRGLDLLSHNIFDRRTLDAATSRETSLVLDAPAMIAEMDPTLSTRDNLDARRLAGYQGVGIWGWGTDDRYAWSAGDLDQVAAPLRADRGVN